MENLLLLAIQVSETNAREDARAISEIRDVMGDLKFETKCFRIVAEIDRAPNAETSEKLKRFGCKVTKNSVEFSRSTLGERMLCVKIAVLIGMLYAFSLIVPPYNPLIECSDGEIKTVSECYK